MIDVFDEFFQMNTLFKIGVFLQKIGLINNLKGVIFDESYFGQDAITHFEESYLRPNNLINCTHMDTTLYRTIPAGKGVLVFETT